MHIEFYFDFLSPYAYLTWKTLPTLLQELPGLSIKYRPIVFAALLNHWGHKGPAEIPPKRDYVFTHCLRIAQKQNFAFTLPKYHPFNPIISLRLALVEVSGEEQFRMIDTLWHAAWAHGLDIADESTLRIILAQKNFSEALLEKTHDPMVKNILKIQTAEAINRGVFGVPTFLTEDETLFWGLDSLPNLIDHLQGKNSITSQKLRDTIHRERGAER